jgi:outer membrane protein assembly factor BamB
MAGNIWVMCSGRKDYHPGGFSPSHLLRIHPETFDITADFIIQENEHDAIGLSVNKTGDILFYLFKGDIYQFETDATQPDDKPLVDYQGTFYSMGYDPVGNTLYGADALDYTQNGEIYSYDAHNGTLLMNFKAGIIPGGFYFSKP